MHVYYFMAATTALAYQMMIEEKMLSAMINAEQRGSFHVAAQYAKIHANFIGVKDIPPKPLGQSARDDVFEAWLKYYFEILDKIGKYRETFFGTPFEVINIPKPNNQAYTADALANHSDLPYYEYVPGYQFLHCLVNDAKGGSSTAVDSFAVANFLKKNHLKRYKLLTEYNVIFKDNDFTQKNVRVQKSPIIKVNKNKDFEEVRINLGAMGTLDLDPKIMDEFYNAYIFFYKQLHSKKFQISFKLKAGNIFCFDNRRILHGRTQFDPNSGKRHLQGYYIEREEITSKLNYLNKIKF